MREKGFALVSALIAVVLLGALIVGAFVATTEEVRISGNVGFGARALIAAESDLETALGGWASVQADSLVVGQRAARSTSAGALVVTTTLIRLDSVVFWMISDASDAGGGGSAAPSVRRRIGLLVRRVSDSTGKTSLLRLEERSWSELF